MAAFGHGKRLLEEIETETLSDLLLSLQAAHQQSTGTDRSRTGIEELDVLWASHSSGQLQVCGRYRALLYHIISNAVSFPRYGAVLVIDTDGKFDITKLSCSIEDLKHVYIIRTAGMDRVQQALRGGVDWLANQEHASKGRELALKIISGGPGSMTALEGFDIVAGWRGWLRVKGDASDVVKFGCTMSVEEAQEEAAERWAAVEATGWTASCDHGEYTWGQKQISPADEQSNWQNS